MPILKTFWGDFFNHKNIQQRNSYMPISKQLHSNLETITFQSRNSYIPISKQLHANPETISCQSRNDYKPISKVETITYIPISEQLQADLGKITCQSRELCLQTFCRRGTVIFRANLEAFRCYSRLAQQSRLTLLGTDQYSDNLNRGQNYRNQQHIISNRFQKQPHIMGEQLSTTAARYVEQLSSAAAQYVEQLSTTAAHYGGAAFINSSTIC